MVVGIMVPFIVVMIDDMMMMMMMTMLMVKAIVSSRGNKAQVGPKRLAWAFPKSYSCFLTQTKHSESALCHNPDCTQPSTLPPSPGHPYTTMPPLSSGWMPV